MKKHPHRDAFFFFLLSDFRGTRSITIITDTLGENYLGISTSGYERISNITERPLIWEKGADNTSAVAATATNVPNDSSNISGKRDTSASNQTNDLSAGKVSDNISNYQTIGGEL